MMAIVIIILHLLVCILIGIGLWKKIFLSKEYLFPVVVCIPFWGILLLLVEEFYERRHPSKMSEIGVDTLKIQDVKYQHIEMDDRKNQEITVPLEEAMAVDEAHVTRRLMLDMLHMNLGEYVGLLQTASSTDDTELAHYATTAMMEIQGKYEQEIHNLNEQLEQDPDNIILLRKCREKLSKYIDSELLSGKILHIYRVQLDEILQKLCSLEPDNRKYKTQFIDNRIALHRYEGLEEQLKDMIKSFPEDGTLYRTAVDYYWYTEQGDKIQEILELMEKQGVYLTHEGKEWYQFWKQDGTGK